jgi:hypothetical protein
MKIMEPTQETISVTLDLPRWLHEYMQGIAQKNRRSLRQHILFEVENNITHVQDYCNKLALENPIEEEAQ